MIGDKVHVGRPAIAADALLTASAPRELACPSVELGRSAGLRVADHLFDRAYRSQDSVEGPRAFAGKQPPRWNGR